MSNRVVRLSDPCAYPGCFGPFGSTDILRRRCAGGTLLGFSQWEGEKEATSFVGARRMNAATQTAGQLADDRQPATAYNEIRCRAIVRDRAPYDVACKQQLQFRFRTSFIESSMSCHVGEQLGYDQPKLPAAFALKPQIIHRTQQTYTKPVQSVFRDGEAKMLEVACGVGQVPRIRH